MKVASYIAEILSSLLLLLLQLIVESVNIDNSSRSAHLTSSNLANIIVPIWKGGTVTHFNAIFSQFLRPLRSAREWRVERRHSFPDQPLGFGWSRLNPPWTEAMQLPMNTSVCLPSLRILEPNPN
jgi:hypothetical protein